MRGYSLSVVHATMTEIAWIINLACSAPVHSHSHFSVDTYQQPSLLSISSLAFLSFEPCLTLANATARACRYRLRNNRLTRCYVTGK